MRPNCLAFAAAASLAVAGLARADATYHNLGAGNFSQNWSNTGLITTDDNWSGVPSIIGYLGNTNASSPVDVDPRTYVTAGLGTVDVIANQLNLALTTGGVAEFHITDPVVALQGSGTADTPGLVLHLNASGRMDVQVSFNIRDIDSTSDNVAQQFAVQWRAGGTGNFNNVYYLADATAGPDLIQTTAASFMLPAGANNQSQLELRFFVTNATGADEWVGVDDIVVSSVLLPEPGSVGLAGLGLLGLLRRRRR